MTSAFATTRSARCCISVTILRSAALLALAAHTGAAFGQVTILPATTPGSYAHPLTLAESR